MSDLNNLYTNAIVEHSKAPRNFHELETANRKASGHNPLCGDKFNVFLYIDNTGIADIGFTGSGCAIATASASMMTEKLKGKTETEARAVFTRFIDLLTGCPDFRKDSILGELSVFSGVREYPARVKCATLIWHTLQAALDGQEGTVETE
jgi:nitrogen fixation NifU-like protein